jgi:hypothetical protein
MTLPMLDFNGCQPWTLHVQPEPLAFGKASCFAVYNGRNDTPE